MKSLPTFYESKLAVIESDKHYWNSSNRHDTWIRTNWIAANRFGGQEEMPILCDPLCNWAIRIMICMQTVCTDCLSRSMTKRRFTIHPREDTSVFAESQVTYYCYYYYVTASRAQMKNRVWAEYWSTLPDEIHPIFDDCNKKPWRKCNYEQQMILRTLERNWIEMPKNHSSFALPFTSYQLDHAYGNYIWRKKHNEKENFRLRCHLVSVVSELKSNLSWFCCNKFELLWSWYVRARAIEPKPSFILHG